MMTDMARKDMLKALTLLLPIALAGCGGGGGGGTATSDNADTTYSDATNAYHVMSVSVTGDTTTGATGVGATLGPNVPSSGTATFDGYAAFLVTKPSDKNPSLALLSPATITADFANSKLSGSASAFTGRPIDPSSSSGNYTGDAAAYSGQIALSNGCIGTACPSGTGAQRVGATAAGTLQGGGNTVVVNQALTGQFYGNPLSAIDLNGTSSSATLNGATAKSSLDFVATK